MTADGPRTDDADDASAAIAIEARALGERLGRYQLVMPLAQGGMGLVFAGRLLGAHGVERLVAIKTLRPITSANDRAALLREARLTSRLHHRNVVATLDLGEVDDVPYVVMELVDGVSLARLLASLIERKERLSVELAAWLVMQAAHGLHAAHELTDGEGHPLGLVHRDVSPQNILLSMSGEVKMADFGIAKFAGREESTATGMIKGKFGYMSPEQASAAELDRRSDVFALGIVLWEALVQEKLFSAETPARTILRVVEHSPRAPIDVRPEVGPEISAIVMRCLTKDASQRFATAALVADALRSALRARAVAVDEGDLAALVDRLFGAERRDTMDRLRNEPIAHVALPLAPPEASAVVAVSLSTPQPRRTRWRRAFGVGAAIVGVLASGIALWRGGANAPPTPAAAPSTDVPLAASLPLTAAPPPIPAR
jgi:eukaryotic-like serine/threonine-protein kinase